MIDQATGNLLAADTDALVNTVNTVGVMGKGIALQFKRAYPEMFRAYVAAHEAGQLRVGRMFVWPTGALDGPRFIINFPTKKHWRNPSKLEYIDAGLEDLAHVIRDLGIQSIALPPLGAGNGGLDWAEVRPRIVRVLGRIDGLRTVLYEPAGAPAAREMATAGAREPLTTGRAALVEVVSRYLLTAIDASLIEVQKLMYFLQEAGEPLGLHYRAAHYGPYADNLRHVLITLEGTYLTGYGDGSQKVLEAEPIEPLAGAREAAARVLASQPETRRRIDRVIALAAGFDSMYGMELLATVHWAAAHNGSGSSDAATVSQVVRSWSRRKSELFTQRHITLALEHLTEQGWMSFDRPAPVAA